MSTPYSPLRKKALMRSFPMPLWQNPELTTSSDMLILTKYSYSNNLHCLLPQALMSFQAMRVYQTSLLMSLAHLMSQTRTTLPEKRRISISKHDRIVPAITRKRWSDIKPPAMKWSTSS
jgi:16S rRNA C1402 N4-methylase RsmH